MTPPMNSTRSYPNPMPAYPPPPVSYPVRYPAYGYPAPFPAPFPVSPVHLVPGAGLVAAVLGIGLSAAGLLGVPWASGVTFIDLFKANKDKPTPSDSTAAFVHNFVSGGGYGIAAIGAVLAGLWCCGVIGRRLTRPYNMVGVATPRLMRTRVIISSFQMLFLATQCYGVWTLFDGHFDSVKAGPWLLIAGAALLVVASLIGPMVKRTAPPRY